MRAPHQKEEEEEKRSRARETEERHPQHPEPSDVQSTRVKVQKAYLEEDGAAELLADGEGVHKTPLPHTKTQMVLFSVHIKRLLPPTKWRLD